MNSDKIQAFPEGDTEDAVLTALCSTKQCSALIESRHKPGQSGEEQQNKKLALYLRDFFDRPDSSHGCLRILIVRDQDQREIQSVVDSVANILRGVGPKARLDPRLQLVAHPHHDRVFVAPESPLLRLVLHVSGDPSIRRTFPAVCKLTMDDHVLGLALGPKTAQRMLAARCQLRQSLGADRLIAKVTREIPELLANNGMTPFVASKDHIRFYAALLGISTSPAVFAKTVLGSADPSELRTHFAALLAAVDALSDPALGGAC